MPYITQDARSMYDDDIDALIETLKGEGIHPGHINYIITRLVLGTRTDTRYKDFNEAIGILECAKQELYRQHVGPYEDLCRATHGEVYGTNPN